MPLADPGPIIAQAHARGLAVIGANVSTIQMVRGVVRAAEDAQRPVLIQFNRSGLSLIGGVDIAAHVVKSIAEDSEAEIALHLDHADTLDELSAAINAGFGSVMIDGSTLPFDQHLTLAQSAKGLVTWSRLSLEAELGHVAGDEAGVTIGDASWTNPDEAARFVEATGVDWLAVAVGNTHGGPAVGGLQAERLQAIRDVAPVPLVLHGASGLTDDELRVAVNLGVAKINVGTALHQAAARGMADWLSENPNDLRGALSQSEVAVREEASTLLAATWAFGG
ncbi:MAG: class II fructose-bisphosphate aldolase [Chloroflexota bacterium]|nr:class II fructose-bisphosphate aldolase [Chloroflexota bacterium]MDE2894690.1 class II fructose-bisphosphate aldolase [Chloroflexota bacterium]